MFAKYKTYLMGLVFLFLIVLLAFFYINRSQTSTAPKEILPAIKLPRTLSFSPMISFKINEKDINLPDNVPVLNSSPTNISESEIKQIATSLGFNQDPVIANDIDTGQNYIWSTNEGNLLIIPALRKISFSSTKTITSSNANLTDDDYIKIASDFLTSNTLTDTGQIRFSSLVFLKENLLTEGFQETNNDQAQVAEVRFNYGASDYEILDVSTTKPTVYVRILLDGSVYEAEIIKLGNILNSQNTYELKNLTEIKSSTENAVVVNIGLRKILSEFSKSDIKEIEITDVDLAYLLDSPRSQQLQPIFLLKGTANTQQGKVEATLYLPAIK